MSYNSTNYGNQRLVFDFHQEARAKGFNEVFCDILPYGIYTGGQLKKVNDNLIQVAPVSVIIRSNENDKVALKVITTEVQEIPVNYIKPYIILRFGWANTDNTFMDMKSVSWSTDPAETDENKLWPLDIILGKVQFVKGNDDNYVVNPDRPFDLSKRTDVFLKEAEGIYSQLRVSTSETNKKRVYVAGGQVITSKGRFIISGGDFPSFDIPDTDTQARTDLVVVDSLGKVQLIQGTPSVNFPAPAPKYGTFKILAEIRREANRKDICGSDIVQVFDASRLGTLEAEDFPLSDVENFLPTDAKNIEAAFNYLFHHNHLISPDDASVLEKVLRKHIKFGVSDPDDVYAANLPVKDNEGLFSSENVESVLTEIAGAGRTTETIKGIADCIHSLIYEGSCSISNNATSHPIFFCKVKPYTASVINLKVIGPAGFMGAINFEIAIGSKEELSKASITVLSTSIPTFFSNSDIYLATDIAGTQEDFVFVGVSVITTGEYDFGIQALSSEKDSISNAAYSISLNNIPHVRFKVSDGYLAGQPTLKPIRELNAFRQWSPLFQYKGNDPVFLDGSAYFANPVNVPNEGESPISHPSKWIQLARADSGALDITEGAKTPQLFDRPGIIISNTTALKLRQAHQDQGVQYPSLESRVYHFDDDLLDQDQKHSLETSITHSLATNAISPHFVNEDSLAENLLTSLKPAITKKPFKETPSFYFGSYQAVIEMPITSDNNVLDYWFKIVNGRDLRLFDIILSTGERIELFVGLEEAFFNDNTEAGTVNNFLYNTNVLLPGTVPYNERYTDDDLAIVQSHQDNTTTKDLKTLIAPKPNSWNHISLCIKSNAFHIFLNGKQESISRITSGFGKKSSTIIINPDKVPIGLDEMLVDFNHSIDFSRFIKATDMMTSKGLSWAYHEWEDGWLTIYGDDETRIDSNLAMYLFPIGSVMTQASLNGKYNESQTPWGRFHNFSKDQFILQGEVAPVGGNGQKTRFWQRVR